MPGYTSPDYAASEVLADVLSSQRSNLFALVPEGKALFAGFSLSTLPEAGLGYGMAAFPRGADASALVDEVRQIVAEYIRKGFPADLVEAAKRTRLTKAELQKNSIFGLATAWSKALAVEGRQSPEDDVKAIQRVSVADVDRVAKKYLKMDETVVAILTPETSGKPVPSKTPGGVESFAPQRVKSVKLPDWAEKALKRLSIPSSTVNPVATTLSNGITLIVQPESVSDTVSVYGHIKQEPDLETPKDKEGVDQVLSQLFSYGTATLDRLAFQKALDEIGASESAGTDFSLDVLSHYFDRGVELLADNELNPALPEKAFTVTRQQVAATVAGQLQSPDYLTERALKTALFPENDPTLRQATPASISSLTLQDVKDYYRNVFRPDLTTIVVIGKVTPENAKSVIEKHFGSWKATGPKPETQLPPVPANKPSTTAVPDTSRIQDEGNPRSNPWADPVQSRLLCPGAGQSCPGRGFLCDQDMIAQLQGIVVGIGPDQPKGLSEGCLLLDTARIRTAVVERLAGTGGSWVSGLGPVAFQEPKCLDHRFGVFSGVTADNNDSVDRPEHSGSSPLRPGA